MRNSETDNELGPVESYLPLVHYIARNVSSKLVNVDYDDIVSYGVFGLLDAMKKFDASRGYQFQTYASSRIRGAIFDELRVIDWVPRSIRAKIKFYNETATNLEVSLMRPPTVEEVATEMNLSVEEAQVIAGHALQGQPLASLQFQKSSPDEDGTYTLEDEIEDASEVNLDLDQLYSNLINAIQSLGDKEQVMMVLYYFSGKTLAEIGRILGLTESRACQIHSRSLSSLAKEMRDDLETVMNVGINR